MRRSRGGRQNGDTVADRGGGVKEELQAEGAAHGGSGGGAGRNVEADFKGEKRSNDTRRSTTDPDAKFYRKGPEMEANLCFIGHAPMENRSGLIVDTRLTRVVAI